MTAAPARGDADFAAASARSATFADAARIAARLAATLGWSPAAFWASTPADLRLALGLDLPADGVAPAAAADLARLKEAFPDGPSR
jgi:hypothetical protein